MREFRKNKAQITEELKSLHEQLQDQKQANEENKQKMEQKFFVEKNKMEREVSFFSNQRPRVRILPNIFFFIVI